MGVVATLAVFSLHILSGFIALAAGLAALCVSKGGRLHRRTGDVFVLAMAAMAVSAAVLGVVRPGQIVNVFIAALTLYLVATSWLAARRPPRAGRVFDFVALAVSILLCAPFAALLLQAATGLVLFQSAFALKGPILVALCVFSGVMASAAVGDLRVVLSRGLAPVPRVARHLWRMCFALAMAFGSAFTNGFARLLPGPYHVPPAFFAPQLFMLAVLVFWLFRVRFPGWRGNASAALGAAERSPA